MGMSVTASETSWLISMMRIRLCVSRMALRTGRVLTMATSLSSTLTDKATLSTRPTLKNRQCMGPMRGWKKHLCGIRTHNLPACNMDHLEKWIVHDTSEAEKNNLHGIWTHKLSWPATWPIFKNGQCTTPMRGYVRYHELRGQDSNRAEKSALVGFEHTIFRKNWGGGTATLLLYLCYVFQALTDSFVCWFYTIFQPAAWPILKNGQCRTPIRLCTVSWTEGAAQKRDWKIPFGRIQTHNLPTCILKNAMGAEAKTFQHVPRLGWGKLRWKSVRLKKPGAILTLVQVPGAAVDFSASRE